MSLKPVYPRKQRALQAKLDRIASLEDKFKLLLEHFKLEDKEEEEEQFHDAFDEPLPKQKEPFKKTREKERAKQEQHARARALDWKLARNQEAIKKAEETSKESSREQRRVRALLSAQEQRFSQVRAELEILEGSVAHLKKILAELERDIRAGSI